MELKELSDFSMLFELAATLNLACAAVEYAASYSVSIAKNVFRFHDHINERINECRSHIDNETIDNLKSHTIDGKSCLPHIQKTKRDKTTCNREILNLKTELTDFVKKQCTSNCISFICLYLFLYCIMAGFAMAYNCSLMSSFWTIFTVASCLIVIATFVSGEIYNWANAFFRSLKWCVISFSIAAIISYMLAYKFGTTTELLTIFWPYIAPVSAILPYSAFILFIIAIRIRAKKIRDEIDSKSNIVKEKCVALENDVRQLASIHNFSVNIQPNHGTQQITINVGPDSAAKTNSTKANKKKKRNKTKGKKNAPTNNTPAPPNR